MLGDSTLAEKGEPPADFEIADTVGLETCATVFRHGSHGDRMYQLGFWISCLFRHSCFVICCPGLPFQYLLLDFFMPERIQKPVEPAPWGPKQGDGGGPRSPDVSRPDTKDLLKKMRKVDPNQSKRYRQRTGQ